jgi:hypothetical protein
MMPIRCPAIAAPATQPAIVCRTQAIAGFIAAPDRPAVSIA